MRRDQGIYRIGSAHALISFKSVGCKYKMTPRLVDLCVDVIVEKTWEFTILTLSLPRDLHNNLIFGWSWRWLMLNHDFLYDHPISIYSPIAGYIHTSYKRHRKTLYENYAGFFDSYTDFCDILDKLTDDYTPLEVSHTRSYSWTLE